MLSPAARATADTYWARYFGIAPERLRPAEPLVVPHAAELADYSGASLHAFDDAAPFVFLPPSLLAAYAERVAEAARRLDGRWEMGGVVRRIAGVGWARRR